MFIVLKTKGEAEDEKSFAQIEQAILNNIEGENLPLLPFKFVTIFQHIDLHWNEEEKMYCDLNVDANGIQYLGGLCFIYTHNTFR